MVEKLTELSEENAEACNLLLDLPSVYLPDQLPSLEATLTTPSGAVQNLVPVCGPQNTLGLDFVPDSEGVYLVEVLCDGQRVDGSPFYVTVDRCVYSSSSSTPTVGKQCELNLHVAATSLHTHAHNLRGTLLRPTTKGEEETLTLKINYDNTVGIVFLPSEPGLHQINIRKLNEHVAGSPFDVWVRNSTGVFEERVNIVNVPVQVEVDLWVSRDDHVTLLTPDGTPYGTTIDLLGENETSSEQRNIEEFTFTPATIGRYQVNVRNGDGEEVEGSPVHIYVNRLIVGFQISNIPDMDVEDLNCVVVAPSGREETVPLKPEPNGNHGNLLVTYQPSEVGKHLIYITRNDGGDDVGGSPYMVLVEEDSLSRDHYDMDAFKVIYPNKAPSFKYRVPASDSKEIETPKDDDIIVIPGNKEVVVKYSGDGVLTSSVIRPSGKEDDVPVVATETNMFSISFIPDEVGEHILNIKLDDEHVPTSPLKIIIQRSSTTTEKASAQGAGLERGCVGEPCKFSVSTSPSMTSQVGVSIEGPSKTEVRCLDDGDGGCEVTWFASEAGEYVVHVCVDGSEIPGSPYKVNIEPCEGESVVDVGEDFSYTVEVRVEEGEMSANVVTPSHELKECPVSYLEDEGNYVINYVPTEPGDHVMNVFLNGSHVPGSPFSFTVRGLETKPGQVTAHGQGLEEGQVGEPGQFTVMTSQPGSLTLSIDGPSKVPLKYTRKEDDDQGIPDVIDEFDVTYIPPLPGIYDISIRMDGQHIPGSPFNVEVIANEDESIDASKCITQGAGLRAMKCGVSGGFIVDAGAAGRSELMVGVEGEGGLPASALNVQHIGNYKYNVRYVLDHPGKYVLKVLWGGSHVPGSPYIVLAV